jgi:hypothetical protein
MAAAVHGGSGIPSFSTRHGDEEEEGFPPIGGRPGKPHGSSEAAPGSSSTTALHRQATAPTLLVGVGYFRPEIEGEQQPPGSYAKAEAF